MHCSDRKKAAKSATASEIKTQSAENVVFLTPAIFDGWFREAA